MTKAEIIKEIRNLPLATVQQRLFTMRFVQPRRECLDPVKEAKRKSRATEIAAYEEYLESVGESY